MNQSNKITEALPKTTKQLGAISKVIKANIRPNDSSDFIGGQIAQGAIFAIQESGMDEQKQKEVAKAASRMLNGFGK